LDLLNRGVNNIRGNHELLEFIPSELRSSKATKWSPTPYFKSDFVKCLIPFREISSFSQTDFYDFLFYAIDLVH